MHNFLFLKRNLERTDWRKARTKIRRQVRNLMSQPDVIITWTEMIEVGIVRFKVCFKDTANKVS